MQVLGRDLSYVEVAEIFVRVNSLGAKLRGSDLALAQITAKWRNSLKLFEDFADKCAETWSEPDVGLLVRLMVVMATRQSQFRTVGSIPLKSLQEAWEQAKDSFCYAANFLRTNADIEHIAMLSSPFLIIPIAVYGALKKYDIPHNEEKEMLRWLYGAHARAHYSSSSESKLDADLNILFSGAGFSKMLEPLIQRFARLEIDANDLKGRGERSPLFTLAYLALKHNGAKDWQSGLGLSMSHQGSQHRIEYHHIFPKAILPNAGYEKAEINEIANMAFISGGANRRISKKPPVEYFPNIINNLGNEALESCLIPMDKSLWDISAYKDFLEYRRTQLAQTINTFVNAACNNGMAVNVGGLQNINTEPVESNL